MIEWHFDDDLEKLTVGFDPRVIERAREATLKRLASMAATRISQAARREYVVKARDIKDVLTTRSIRQGQNSVRVLLYRGRRLSLRYFTPVGNTGASPSRSYRPRTMTARGIRYGARVRERKTRPARIVQGGFWGRGRTNRVLQIFQRTGSSRLPIKKLTGPSIAHMVRNQEVTDTVNELMRDRAPDILRTNLNFFFDRAIRR